MRYRFGSLNLCLIYIYNLKINLVRIAEECITTHFSVSSHKLCIVLSPYLIKVKAFISEKPCLSYKAYSVIFSAKICNTMMRVSIPCY